MTLRKTILYIGGFILPDGNAAAHRVLANGSALDAIGFDVTYLGVDPRNVAEEGACAEECLPRGKRYFFQQYPKSIFDWARYLSSLKAFRSAVERVGIKSIAGVFAYNCPAIVLYRIQQFCKRRGISVVADCTEWYQPESGSFIFRLLKNFDTHLRMKIIQPKLNGIMCISSFMQEYYKQKKCNTVLVPPLVDKQDTKWKRPIEEEAHSHDLRFVYAGSPGSSKDRLDITISALSKPACRAFKFSLSVIGICQEEYLNGDPQRREQLGVLGNRVVFMGRIPHLGALEVIKRSSFSIFFRDNTIVSRAGFPTKFVESITCGTPVITNMTSDLSKFLVPSINGFFLDATSIDTIADGLLPILGLKEKQIAEMKAACLHDKSFDFRVYIQAIASFLSRCGIQVPKATFSNLG